MKPSDPSDSRVQIRGLQATDGDALSGLYAQPSVIHGTLQLPFPPQHLWLERAKSPAPGIHQLVACIDGQLAGHLGLHMDQNARRRHVAGFGMGVDDRFRRRGVGGALVDAAVDVAVNWRGIQRIEIDVYVDNEAAIGLYSSRGFEIEGVRRAFALRGGALVDVFTMSRLQVPDGTARVRGELPLR